MRIVYVSPTGNYEVYDDAAQPTPPAGYYTVEEWEAAHPAPPPPEPTVEEKIAALDAEYQREKSTLCEQYTDSHIPAATETAAAIVDEMNDLDAWYDGEYQRIINEQEG